MGKAITARIYIGGEPISKVEYKTGENSKYGKKLARLVLDEFLSFTKTMAEGDAMSWAITYDDGEEEFAFVSTDNQDRIGVEINGEPTETFSRYGIRSTEAMWEWLAERGWY